ncbi:Cytoskeleton-associated protein 5 [Nymphon striatum]|nr:Cytoskeleton-associated protein 5 [Nymphon striatum]
MDAKEEDTEYLKLSIEDRCQHKLWNARVNGYEEAKKLFEQVADEKSSEFNKYLGLIKKFVIDSNAVAQEKGLDAALAFTENAAIAGKNFGHKVLTLKPLVKLIPKLLEDRDKNIREMTKQLTVEIYRWIGAPIKSQLQNLKPVQITELEKEFEKVSTDNPVQIRFLRSQQEMKLNMAAGSDDIDEEDDKDEANETPIDPCEFLDPVDILSQLPKDFYDKCEAKKWQERKGAMEILEKLCANPKLESGDYGDLVKVLKKTISKDTNIMIVGLAGKCLAGLANGLKKKFQSYVSYCIPAILEKFKEKKPTVLHPMREAADSVYACGTFDMIMEDLLASLQNKNPNVKAETLSFISRIFSKSSPAVLTKKVLKTFCAAILITLNDADGVVRDNSAIALGTAMKVVGEKAITPFLQDVDSMKLGKINECCDKAEVVQKSIKPKGAKTTSQKTQSKTAALSSAKTKPPPVVTSSNSKASKPTRSAPSKENAIRGKSKKTKSPAVSESKQIPMEKELSKEEAEEAVESLLSADVLSGLYDSNWKERLSAMQTFSETIRCTEGEQLPIQALIIILSQKPGFKDTNFQVLNLKFLALSEIAKKASMFSQTSANCCILAIIDKIGDVKAGANASEALSCIAEATTLKFVNSELQVNSDSLKSLRIQYLILFQALAYAFTQKNPKNQVEAINWLSKSIKEFGFNIDLKPTIALTKKGLAATNPAIRTSCISLISVMYMYMGQALRTFYEDEKSALLQQIDSECEKISGTRPPAPTRGVTSNKTNEEEDNEGNEGNEGGMESNEVNLADLIPRSDFGAQIPSSVINDLSDKNWKVRATALDKLKSLLTEVKFITPNLGDLLIPLKSRLNETNKNLLIHFLNFTQSLATALGPGTKQHVRILIPAVFSALGDNKNTVRAAALSCLQIWTENASFFTFVDGEMLLEALKPENPFMRTEIIGWLIDGLNSVKSVPNSELNLLVPMLYTCIEDRSADVRKKAQDAVLPFMTHLGFESMARAAGKLNPSSKTPIIGHLDKAKANLPAKPIKSKSACKAKVIKDDDNDNISPNPPLAQVSLPSKDSSGSSKRAPSKTRKPETVSKSKKKEEELEVGPTLPSNNLKDQRMADEKALKVLKWNFTTPREEFSEQLKDQICNAGLSRSLQTNMFHSDFKFHLKAIDTLIDCIESCPDGVVCNVDLILKWFTLRFFDTNPSVLLKSLEFLQMLFNLLQNASHHLSECDASSFIPYLVLKVGDPKDPVRKGVREIFKLLCKVYPSNKMFSFLMHGLSSKNARQRTECLDELGNLIEKYGMSVCQPSAGAALKEIAKQISDRDNSVRNAALNCIVQAYFIERDRIYKLVGHLNDKDMSLLEERIKRASKNRPTTAPVTIQKIPEVKCVKSGGSKQAAQNTPKEPEISNDCNSCEDVEPQIVIKRFPPRPVSARPMSCGPFTLDFDSIEKMVEGPGPSQQNFGHVNLIKHDLSDMTKPTPALPKSKSRPPSPAQKALSMSSDATATMDFVISQIASNDIRKSICALAQIDELLHDAEKAESMVTCVDKLLLTASVQYRMVYNRYMSDPNTSKYEVIKVYRMLTTTLVSLFQNNILAKAATTDILRDLILNLLTVLLDGRLNSIDDGPLISKSINILMVKVVEKSDHTNVLSALIKLLQECCGSEPCSVKLTDLVMKCIWKMIRMMAHIINSNGLDLDRILYDLHIFLKQFPIASWKERSMDTPLRTIKTILHSLAKAEGNKILSHVTLIEDVKNSEVVAYLHRVLKDSSKHQSRISSSEINSPDVVADARNATRREVNVTPRGLSKNTQEMLAAIFKKIGSKENTKEGLSDLYDFKQNYPESNIEPFLRKSSEFFQSYVEKGLKTIEQEKNNNTATANINLTQTVTKSTNNDSTADYSCKATANADPNITTNLSVYMERLKVIRAKCGLDNSKYERNSESITKTNVTVSVNTNGADTDNVAASVPSNMNCVERTTTANLHEDRSNMAYLESIRKRIEATKQSSAT